MKKVIIVIGVIWGLSWAASKLLPESLSNSKMGMGLLTLVLLGWVLLLVASLVRKPKPGQKEGAEAGDGTSTGSDKPDPKKAAATAKPEKKSLGQRLAYSVSNYLIVTIVLGVLVIGGALVNGFLQHGTPMPSENPFVTAKFAEEWKLTWTKPPGFRGKDPSVRSGTYTVKMLRDDELAMEFIQYFSHQGSTQTAKFVWDKKDTRGIWYQEKPLNSGTWYLLPEKNPGGRTVRWTGVQTSEDAKINGQPVEIPMTLVLHLKPVN